MSDKVPFSKEAEQFVIGSCLLSEDSIGVCFDNGITEEHFYDKITRSVWKGIHALYSTGKVVDLATVQVYMDSNGLSYGDSTGLDDMVDYVTTHQYVDHFVEVLVEKEKIRRALRIGTDIIIDVKDQISDADTLLTKIAESAMNATGKSRRSPSDFHEEHKERRNRAKKDGIVGLPVQAKGIDTIIASWCAPDNVIIAGKSSAGKTDFMLTEFIPQARNGVPVGIFELDMNEFDLRERMAGFLSEVNTFIFRKDYWTNNHAERIDRAYEELESLPIYINDKPDATINDIYFQGVLWKKKYGIKMFSVDYLQYITLTPDEGRRDYRLAVGYHAAKIKNLGKRYGMTTFTLSQLARFGDKTSELTPAVPNMEALKESGSIEQSADIVILVAHEPELPVKLFSFENPVWDMIANVDKQRNGPTGKIPLCFYPSRHRFISRTEGVCIRTELENKED